jgi:hypothetical protein
MAKYALLIGLMLSIGACDSPQKQVEPQDTHRNSAVLQAKARREAARKIIDMERKFGIMKSLYLEDESFLKFIPRIEANQKLQEALLFAKNNNVTVFVSDRFDEAGWVVIDHRATDDEIIKFLLGE